MTFEALPNASRNALSGAGIQAAQTMANKGAKVILTGKIGPNAHQAFSAAGIQMITGVSGTVREAVEKFKSGQLRETTPTPTAPMGFDMGGSGMGMGMGRGGGRGRGRGMGIRLWQTIRPHGPSMTNPRLTQPMSAGMSRQQEIQVLESQMDSLQQQLGQIKKRIEAVRKQTVKKEGE
jgi:predicted Fe-Mo cluster-binding NifX family protein